MGLSDPSYVIFPQQGSFITLVVPRGDKIYSRFQTAASSWHKKIIAGNGYLGR